MCRGPNSTISTLQRLESTNLLQAVNRGGYRSCCAPDVSMLFSLFLRTSRLIAFSCSSALCSARVSVGIFTTMASADSSRALTQEVSPGKMHELQTRAVRLYLARLSVTFGFRASSRTHRPHKASLPVRVPTVVSFAVDCFRLTPSREPLGPSLRFLSRFPVISFRFMTCSCSCWAHEGRVPPRPIEIGIAIEIGIG